VKYHAVIAGQERLLEVSAKGSHFLIAIYPGADASGEPQKLEIDAVHLHGLAVSILAKGKSYACDLEPGQDGKVSVRVNHTAHALEMLDERKLRMRKAGGKFSLDGPQRIDAPMPGKVVRVLVKKGDTVTEGQGLVVVEAMKMENELKSPKAGVVSDLFAVEGAAVENGAKLVIVT
jgi:biotin carboxyl carrier protein